MGKNTGNFHMETAGSLTPELEGAPVSGVHPRTTKEKEGQTHDEARQEEKGAVPAPQKTR